jgi:hypothetical protein
VFVIQDGTAKARTVELAEVRDSDRRIAAGVAPGERLVGDPTSVRDGQRVAVADQPQTK